MLLLSFAQTLMILASGGLYWGLTYWTGKDPQLFSGLVSNSVLHVIGVMVITFLSVPLVLFTAPAWLPNVNSIGLLLVLLGIPLLVWLECLRYLLLGQQAIFAYALLPPTRILLWLLCNLVVLLFIWRSVSGVILAWLIQLVMLVIGFTLWFIRRYRPCFAPSRALYGNTIRTGFKGLASYLAVSLMYNGDVYLLNHLVSLESLGYYSIAVSVIRVLQRSANVAGTLLFPVSSGDTSGQADHLTARVVRNVLLLNLLLCVVAVSAGRTLLVLAFGQEFANSYKLLLWLLPGFLANTGPIIIGPNLWGKGYPKIVVVAPLVSFIGNLLLNLVLVPTVGIAGASIASSISYVVWTALLAMYFVSHTTVSYSELFIVKLKDLRGYYQLGVKAKQSLLRLRK